MTPIERPPGARMTASNKYDGKTVAKMEIETVREPAWGEIFDRLIISFTDGSKARFRSQFCSTQHSKIWEEGAAW